MAGAQPWLQAANDSRRDYVMPGLDASIQALNRCQNEEDRDEPA